ncbi:MAG TPA: hypothetical protein V6D07_03170 [Trichocoleus sp.]
MNESARELRFANLRPKIFPQGTLGLSGEAGANAIAICPFTRPVSYTSD